MADLTLINGDCLKILPQIPKESVDLAIIDPPYGISQPNKSISRKLLSSKLHKRNADIKLDFGEWDHFENRDEYFKFTELWFKEVVRILKPKSWIYIFFDKQKTGYFDLILARKYGIKPRTILVWHKSNPTPQFRKVNWISASEFIWVGSKGECKLKNFLSVKEMHSVFEYPNASIYGKTNHPTEKPLDIIKKIVITSTNEGETVIDPFLGSGTTMQACLELNRNCIGIEISEDYCENIIIPRIKPLVKQTTLTAVSRKFKYCKYDENGQRKVFEITNVSKY